MEKEGKCFCESRKKDDELKTCGKPRERRAKRKARRLSK
jgi:hypothetical protein